jgi:hypothetical protein
MNTLLILGRFDEALILCQKIVQAYERLYPPCHPMIGMYGKLYQPCFRSAHDNSMVSSAEPDRRKHGHLQAFSTLPRAICMKISAISKLLANATCMLPMTQKGPDPFERRYANRLP